MFFFLFLTKNKKIKSKQKKVDIDIWDFLFFNKSIKLGYENKSYVCQQGVYEITK